VLAALVVSLRAELAQTRAELERIAELEARLRQTPRNSSKPPSGEGLARPAPRSLRKKSGRRTGGQDGQKGTTLMQVARPDREVRHEPDCCGRCGGGLAGRPVTGVERRQVLDLPPVRAEVTEHQLIERECACGVRTKAAAPQGAQPPACYGPRIAAVIVYLYTGQFLSTQRTAQALAELSGVPLSMGTVAALTTRAAGRLGGFLEHQLCCAHARRELQAVTDLAPRASGAGPPGALACANWWSASASAQAFRSLLASARVSADRERSLICRGTIVRVSGEVNRGGYAHLGSLIWAA
jgi:transposase